MKKVFLWLVVVSIIVVFSLVGCKETAGEEEETASAEEVTEETTETEAVESEEEPPEEIVISWSGWWELEVGADILDPIEAKFMEEHPEVTIERISAPLLESYDKNIVLAQAGELPDLVGMQPQWVPQFVGMGAIESIQSRLEEEGYIEDLTYSCPYKGENYALIIYGGPLTMLCNTRMFEEAGIDYPTTWDEYLEAARTITDPDNGIYFTACEMGSASESGVYYWLMPLLAQAGGKIQDDEGNIVINSEAGVQALEFLGTLYDEGLLFPGTLSNTEQEKRDAFVAENIALYHEGPWGRTVMEGMECDFSYVPVLFPEGPAGMGTMAGGSGLAIASNSPNKDMAWEFLKFLCFGEGNQIWCEQSGNLSAYEPNLQMDYITGDAYLQVFSEALVKSEIILGVPVIEGAMTFLGNWVTETQNYLNGDKTAQESLDDTISTYKEALEKGEAQ